MIRDLRDVALMGLVGGIGFWSALGIMYIIKTLVERML